MKSIAIFLGLISGAFAPQPMTSPTQKAAIEFLATLSTEQRRHTIFDFNAETKSAWSYVPGKRIGISWAEMSPPQTEAAIRLLKTALGAEGYKKVDSIRGLESVLAELENGNLNRDPSRYWFVFFGDPEGNSPWVWRYEGHHVSLTFGHQATKNQGSVIKTSTPQFLGSNPAEVKSGPQKGKRVLGQEQDLGFKLVQSLTRSQLAKAQLASEAPADIVTGMARKAAIEGHLGVPFSDLDPAQQADFKRLIQVHCDVQAPAEQKRRARQLSAGGYESLVFAWMGPIQRASRHYYRIQGPTFVIEYDNTQADGNHSHTVWRDFEGDFGNDLLKEHYQLGHEHASEHDHREHSATHR